MVSFAFRSLNLGLDNQDRGGSLSIYPKRAHSFYLGPCPLAKQYSGYPKLCAIRALVSPMASAYQLAIFLGLRGCLRLIPTTKCVGWSHSFIPVGSRSVGGLRHPEDSGGQALSEPWRANGLSE